MAGGGYPQEQMDGRPAGGMWWWMEKGGEGGEGGGGGRSLWTVLGIVGTY